MTDPEGHLFIVQGDLTKLSCDDILVPYDGANVSRWGGRDKVATALGLKSLTKEECALDAAFTHLSFDGGPGADRVRQHLRQFGAAL